MKHYFKLTAFLLLIGVLFTAAACREKQAPKPVLNVLFIGNSYTYYNDFPDMLQNMINKSAQSPVKIKISAIVQDSATLEMHWKNPAVKASINDGTQWHYVVLQNQSNWASNPKDRERANFFARKFAAEITKIKAVPLVYVTWPKEIGNAAYQNNPNLGNFNKSYKDLNIHSQRLANDISGKTVPVNDYWVSTLLQAKNIKMYADGSHPTRAGSYLAALVFYKFLIGKPLIDPANAPKGMNIDNVTTLQNIVAQDRTL